MEVKTRQVLERFLANANTVENSSWLKAIREKGLRISLNFAINKPITITTSAPTGDELTALVAILRKFELGREPASFNSLENVVLIDSAISPEWKENFIHVKNSWDSFKDRPSMVGNNLNLPALTSRLLIDTFIYGGLFHDDDEKIRLLQAWKEHPGYIVIESDYHFALLQLWECVAHINEITKLELAGKPVPSVAEYFEANNDEALAETTS